MYYNIYITWTTSETCMTITYTDVQSICNQFEKNQEKITTRKIRDILGEGSLTTISDHLKKWRVHIQDEVVQGGVQSVQKRFLPGDVIGVITTFLFSAATIYLFWDQSTDIYKSLGFENNNVEMAFGAILMVVGFSSYHAYFPKSKLALFCCSYAMIYEGFFVVSGTANADKKDLQAIEYENSGIDLKKMETQNAFDTYTKHNNRYKDKNDEMHENNWYKSKYVDPAYSDYKALKLSLIEEKSKADLEISFGQITVLKVIYRLGLVLLSMLFVHKFIAIAKKIIVR